MNNSKQAKELKSFGLIFSILILVVFALIFPYLFKVSTGKWPYYISIPVVILAIIKPLYLEPLFTLWMKIGDVLGWVNTRIVLCSVFYILFVPLGNVMKLFGWDALRIKMKDKSTIKTYKIVSHIREAKHMEKPY
jgi:hypothetical protein